ncbi:MAG: single-stranded-DNA-specific exonuclease RecJ, partial [Deltaproteobacteria bacterium]|nr:single-stranded-DNA-specific exonuclease RecJ [Deltaproteobacteria bacterium]
ARLNTPSRVGVGALARVAGLRGTLGAGSVGFQIGPRLNAAGRMEGPRTALDLLRTDDPVKADRLARELDGLNRRRREEEQAAVAAARARVEAEGWWPERHALVLEADDWHPGVVGLVASRLVEAFHRPTVALVRQGERLKGSARSVPGVHLVEVLADCAEVLTRYGGHAAAAGLELPVAALQAFRDRFDEAVSRRVCRDDLVPVLEADAEVGLADLGERAVAELGCLEPHGVGNPRPVFVVRHAEVVAARPLGREGLHRAVVLAQAGTRRDAVAWRVPESWEFLRPGARIDAAFTAELNSWNGNTRVRLTIKDARPAEG